MDNSRKASLLTMWPTLLILFINLTFQKNNAKKIMNIELIHIFVAETKH
jgi:hypothetical protein